MAKTLTMKNFITALLFLVSSIVYSQDTIIIKIGPLIENGGYQSITTGIYKDSPIVIRTLIIVDCPVVRDTIIIKTKQEFKKY